MRMQNRRFLSRLAFLYALDWCVKPICIIAGRSGGKLRRKRVTGQAFSSQQQPAHLPGTDPQDAEATVQLSQIQQMALQGKTASTIASTTGLPINELDSDRGISAASSSVPVRCAEWTTAEDTLQPRAGTRCGNRECPQSRDPQSHAVPLGIRPIISPDKRAYGKFGAKQARELKTRQSKLFLCDLAASRRCIANGRKQVYFAAHTKQYLSLGRLRDGL